MNKSYTIALSILLVFTVLLSFAIIHTLPEKPKPSNEPMAYMYIGGNSCVESNVPESQFQALQEFNKKAGLVYFQQCK